MSLPGAQLLRAHIVSCAFSRRTITYSGGFYPPREETQGEALYRRGWRLAPPSYRRPRVAADLNYVTLGYTHAVKPWNAMN